MRPKNRTDEYGPLKQYVGFARVSSREQKEEGFSLEVQVGGITAHAERNGGRVIMMFKIAETATKSEERKTFREFLRYVKAHASQLDGVLFYKLDRAARNMFDYIELERLESEYGVRFESVTQPSDNSPSGRLLRRSLAMMASFQTEQQSVDVREGIAKRVEEGLFPSRAPYGYENYHEGKRALVRTAPIAADNVKRIFELFTQHALGVPEIIDLMYEEGRFYAPSHPRFSESKVYGILNDEAYLGHIWFRGNWLPGSHKQLVSPAMFETGQALLGNKTYRSHQMVYGSKLIWCGHCGRPITGEPKTKNTKSGKKTYLYYRCSKYSNGSHPRVRLTESVFDAQILALLGVLRDRCASLGQMLSRLLAMKLRSNIERDFVRERELKRQLSNAENRAASLCDKWIDGKLNDELYEEKRCELAEQIETLQTQLTNQKIQIAVVEDMGENAPHLFPTIMDQWAVATYHFKRRVLESVFQEFRLEDEKLVRCGRTPFEPLLA
jgi:DNA invertase Pin-like site-specific DNA recombinase